MPTKDSYRAPTTMAEAAAQEKAIAKLYAKRIESARAVMAGPEALAFQAQVAALLKDALPPGTSAAVNLPAVEKWFQDVVKGLDADAANLAAVIDPPVPAPAA